MPTEHDRILIVESNPDICDLIARQTLQPAGFQVAVAEDANSAISRAAEFAPDLILAELSLPGLSGKDLLVALNAQDASTPVILLAKKGQEYEIIQSIRLGAVDYLIMPAREAEILTVVERILKGVREQRERARTLAQLRSENQEMQQLLKQSLALLEFGKEITAADLDSLPEKIVSRICQIIQADFGWLLVKNEISKAFVLAAQHQLPQSLPVQLHQPWDDGISPLVAVSGEPLAIHGERLKRYKISALGLAALILPLKTSGSVAGILVFMRSQAEPFAEEVQRLAFSAADFASIAIANLRAIRSTGERARGSEQLAANALTNERITNELLQHVKKDLNASLMLQETAFTNLKENLARQLSLYQRDQMDQIQSALEHMRLLSDAIIPPKTTRGQRASRSVNLNEIVSKTANRFIPFVKSGEVTLTTDLPDQLVFVQADEEWLSQALTGLLSNAVKFCETGGAIRLWVEPPAENTAHIILSNSGATIEPDLIGKIFSGALPEKSAAKRPGGPGLGMSLIKDLIVRMNGKIWVENKPGQGVQFHLLIPTQ